jgi:hypothetical protein
MRYVLISADNSPSVYSVPNEVADNLRKYCIDFCDKWLHESPHAKKYHRDGGVCYDEKDFIEYLNKWVFPNMPSVFIETLEWIDSEKDIPEKYKGCDWFNF